MTDEQAAAERLRRARTNEPAESIYGPNVTQAMFLDDCERVIDAYLAEHPADDAVALDEAWLRACGFVLHRWTTIGPQCGYTTQFRVRDFPDGYGVVVCQADLAGVSVVEAGSLEAVAFQVRTRGQLRLLCRALGIPLPPENVP